MWKTVLNNSEPISDGLPHVQDFEKFSDGETIPCSRPINSEFKASKEPYYEVATDKESESTVDDIQLRVMEDERTMFQSAIGTVISCLGSAVGTGNIWRFPRILATQSYYRGTSLVILCKHLISIYIVPSYSKVYKSSTMRGSEFHVPVKGDFSSKFARSLTFYIAWAILLFFWSIPVILVEYAIGRFTKNSPIVSYRKFMGNYFVWLGGWIVVTAFFISAYYSVIIGWCLYYLYVSIAFKELPTTEKAGMEIFDNFSRAPQWPVICQVIAVVIAGIFLFGGIKWIEKANLLLVPLLLAILIFTFGWSLTRPYAEVGIKFLFTPTWALVVFFPCINIVTRMYSQFKTLNLCYLCRKQACALRLFVTESFADPGLWIAAASQNAFDTGAGLSVLFTYATYMSRSAGITKYSVFIPMMNNLVRRENSDASNVRWWCSANTLASNVRSRIPLGILKKQCLQCRTSFRLLAHVFFCLLLRSLYASITIFSTVFSTLIDEDGAMTRSAILQIMQQSGPGSTGLTFTWIPVLFSKVGILGRVLCALFFLCLTFAGISSLLANIQVYVLTAKEIGVVLLAYFSVCCTGVLNELFKLITLQLHRISVPHRIAVAGSLLACVIVGLPSAIKLEILENQSLLFCVLPLFICGKQDNTWGYALIVSGMVLTGLVIVYNPVRFRRIIINNFGTNDWPVPIIWIGIISVVVPVIFVFLIVWWIYDYIREAERWYDVTWTSVTLTLIEWLVVLVVILIINFVVVRIKRDLYVETRKYGSDPHNPETYEKDSILTIKTVRVPKKSVDSVRTV
ncbi:hypothetical protein T265_08892 [Opisthorchis viverrini]|uniref:Sodium:neurotransmitter symporter family protein n=1 Tax=Opisthorchis viverrini TaxID=6198 RepID=A0A074ZIM3_OPIVI|nr:hypothetical protein T265_08892 [Opisthorchis viverrini]KER23160.1 hypothetical protein T265_08892 [Opisthorchis viverrini]